MLIKELNKSNQSFLVITPIDFLINFKLMYLFFYWKAYSRFDI